MVFYRIGWEFSDRKYFLLENAALSKPQLFYGNVHTSFDTDGISILKNQRDREA